jgi:hypothetical protein
MNSFRSEPKISQSTWKMKLAILISLLWFLFWVFAGLVEEVFLWGLGFGGFPIIVCWGLWMIAIHPGKDKDPISVENIKKTQKAEIPERREFERLEYPDTKRPLLKCGGREFPILNISEKGLKLFNEKKIELNPVINGEITLLSGRSILVNGEILWSLSNEFGMLLDPIPTSIITEERGILSKASRNKE